jgi:hypothetical protein
MIVIYIFTNLLSRSEYLDYCKVSPDDMGTKLYEKMLSMFLIVEEL